MFSFQAVPVAGVYTRQLEIYEETIRLDDVIARVFTGPEVNDALSPYAAKGVNIPGLRVFTFNHFLLYWQQDAILTDELVTNLTFAGIGVLVVCMLALANPAALIAVSGVGIVDIFLFASLIIGEFIFMFTRAIRLTRRVLFAATNQSTSRTWFDSASAGAWAVDAARALTFYPWTCTRRRTSCSCRTTTSSTRG